MYDNVYAGECVEQEEQEIRQTKVSTTIGLGVHG
jgi:hypothetical protein